MTQIQHASRAAVVLCGCGRGDGSEIHESTSILIHLARLGVSYQCFAPDQWQADVVDHHTGKPVNERRHCLVEAARIARGNIKPLHELKVEGFDALFFPGGFGAAKNLCTFAADGAGMTIIPEVERVFGEFHESGKPIGLCCIAPVIAAKLLGPRGLRSTLGSGRSTADIVVGWGGVHSVTPCEEACTDAELRVSTSPAYMYDDATPWQVYQGIGRMVEATLGLIGSPVKGR